MEPCRAALGGPDFQRLTEEELEELRQKCEARAKAEAVADKAEAAANRKAKAAADQAVS